MKTIRLKSRIGPTEFTVRRKKYLPDGEYVFDRLRVQFTLDNDCREDIPEDAWKEVCDRDFDRTVNLKFKEAFLVL